MVYRDFIGRAGDRLAQVDNLKDLFGKTCAVIGLGVSNLPLAHLLLDHGALVTVRDKKTREQLGDVADQLSKRGARLLLGESYLDDLTEEILFRSPGLRPDLPAFLHAVENGSTLTSEMELFLHLTPAVVIGITGSDGKTTSTTLTGKLLEKACARTGVGRVYVGGNIGSPLLPLVGEMRSTDFAVVELSSFQLQTASRSPAISAITNLSPNHLDWHVGLDEYKMAKTNVYRHAPNRRLVTNAENAETAALAGICGRPVTLFSSVRRGFAEIAKDTPTCDTVFYLADGAIVRATAEGETVLLRAEEILLPGRHNLENYMTAIALTDGLVTHEEIAEVARTFRGVPHRLEYLRTVGGVRYYNSSIDSSPTRTAAALSALPQSPIVICGGYDKKLPFEPLAEALFASAKAVILMGATAPRIRAAIEEKQKEASRSLPVYAAEGLADAVEIARKVAVSGDTVLLSPACASFDAFRNFEERGNTFRALVENLS